MWELYDELIAGVPDGLSADKIINGVQNTLVKSNGNYGFVSTRDVAWQPKLLPKKYEGMPLRELAACIKSWNFAEASIGLAAINAYYNDPETLRGLGVQISSAIQTEDRASDPFISYQNDIKDKNVAVVGRAPYVDKLFAPVCRLFVIESADVKTNRKNQTRDEVYPEQAAEYILPDCDFVFIACAALPDKTLPRYLNLARKARIILVGQGTTLSPVLHRHGVYDLSGFVVKDGESAEKSALGLGGNTYSFGQKVSLKA